MKAMTKDGLISGVALFFELTDEQFERVKVDRLFIFDAEFLNGCYRGCGPNAHFFSLYNDTPGTMKIVKKKVKELLQYYRTVSWWDKKGERIRIWGNCYL